MKLTYTEIDNLKAGQEMDELVGQVVFGWKKLSGDEIPGYIVSRNLPVEQRHLEAIFVTYDEIGGKYDSMACHECGSMPEFSQRMEDAWRVVDKVTSIPGAYFRLEYGLPGLKTWSATAGSRHLVGKSTADTAALAICKSALLSLSRRDSDAEEKSKTSSKSIRTRGTRNSIKEQVYD